MLIGELVAKSGMSRDTIRFYEKKNLINLESDHRRSNNYKDYPQSALATLLRIKKLKALGFTLSEIGKFISADSDCQDLKYTLEDKITFIDDQIRKLNETKAGLSSSLAKCNRNACELMSPP